MVTSLDTSGITVRRRRRRGDGKQDLSSSLEKENHSPENRGKNPLSNGNISSTVDKFILAAAKTSQAAFWKDKAALVDHVVAASILLRSSSLLLEEHATEILSRCRTLVKEEKEAEVSSNTVNRLCVAVHGLRAVLCTTTTSKRDMVIRLLFFCTVTAADRKDSRYCLAAYNAMCRALENYSVPCIDKDTYIHCEKLNDHGSVIQCPIPQLKPLSKSKYWIIGATDAVQLCTMAISATLAAAQVVVQIEQNSEQDEFGLSLERMSDRVALVRRLICDVAVPWIASSSLAAKKDENLASYCKKAQRILWNLAEDCKDASDRIVLQIDAIRALLLDGSNQDGTVRAILKERNFDNACSISWKVAESLVSQAAQSHSTAKATSIDDAHYNLLQKFHRQVGQVLDAFADAHCPLSYTEYCAYRALHTKSPFRCSNKECSRDCVYRCFLNQYEHQCCETSTTDSCFLALFFLALQVRQLLENGMYDSPAVKREDAMTTVSNFRSKLLRGTPDSAMQIRFYSLLSSINLHRVVDRVLCVESTKEDKCTIQELLDVAATILSSCIGPLCIGLIDNVNEKQGTHLWTFGTACFRQAISIEEIIVRTDAEPNYPKTSRSNMLIGKLSRILTRLPRITPPPDCIENTARFLYVVGKNRFNLGMKIDVLVPLLHSLKLFVHLSPLLSLESLRTLKISNRLVYLSTIYKSLDLIDESVITEVLALSFDALEVSLIPCEVASHVRLFESLAHLTRDVICTGISLDNKLVTNQRSGLVNSLVLSLSQRNRSEHNVLGDDSESAKPSSLDAARIIDLLLDSFRGDGKASGLFEHRSVAAFNLGEILNVMLTTNSMLPHEHSNRSTLLMEKTKAVVEVMVKVAQVLQQNDHRTMETRAASLEDHKCICRLAESFIQQLGTEDATSPNVTTAMLFVVASISLISCHPSLDFDSWTADIFGPNEEIATLFHFNISEKYANKAYIILDALSDGSEWHCVSSAFRSALDLYRFQLSYLRQNERKLYQFDLKGLQVTFENIRVAATPTHVLSALSKRCLIRVLSRLCGLYSLKGEDLRAVQVAKWTIDVLEDKNDDLHSWFETTLLSLLATDSVVFPGLLDVNATVASHPTAFEDKACRLRLLARGTTDFLQLDNIQCSLGLLLEGFNNCVPDCDGRVSFYLQQWSRTTILLGLSECAERRAEMETAHDLLKKCFVQCRNIASSLRRRRYPLVEAEHSFWIAVAVASLLVRCVKRQVECLQKMALLYSRLGTHRKAMDYALLALKMLSPESVMLNTKSEFVDMIQFARIHPSQSCQEMRSRRLLLRLKSQASPLNLVVRMFGVEADGLVLSSALLNRSDQLTANRELEEISDSYEIVDMINGYHAFSLVQDKWNLHALANERFVRYIVSPEVHSLVGTISSLCGQISEPLHQLQYDAKLRDAAIVLSDYQCEGSRAEATALDWLHEVVESSSCSNLSRAWSYYLLGSTALKEARKSGDLQRLWDDSLDQQRCTVSSLSAAQRFFGEALILLGSACDILKRNVERCLALVTGPGTTDNDKNLDSFCLINSSVGGAVRFHMMRSARGTEDNEGAGNGDSNGSSLAAIYGALEHSPSNTSASKSKKWFLNLLGKNIRPGWRFITAALCPTGELLLTSVEYSESLEDYFHCTTCIFPGLDGQSDSCDDLYDEIVKPLNEIVQRSQEQLSEETAAFANIAEKEECARQWWSRRKEVDSELHDLLVRVEQKLLSSNTVQRILLGFSHGDGSLENTDDSLKMSCGNLSSKFEAASIADGQEWKFNVTELSPSKSTEVQRKLEEEDMEAKFGRKIKKSGLARLARQEHESKGAGKYGRFEPTPHAKHACTFLILDESLQRFPFESMSCFKESAICRLPSLPFALAKLVEANKNGASAFSFHPEQTSYILDPESNLSGTKERLLPFLDSLNEKYGAHWKSVVGEIPSSEFMNQGLTAIDGLLLYFGHSGGQQYFSRERIRDMSRMTQGSLASVILMGCSSGKLESVNTKHSTSKEKLPIHYEPEGIALSYLIEGAPCVVGNLWDVTDRDIDRYAMSLLDAVFVNSSDNSIAQSVAMARSACKLRYVVGCAPVCYGLPITGRNMPR